MEAQPGPKRQAAAVGKPARSARHHAWALLALAWTLASALSLALLQRPAHDAATEMLPLRLWVSDVLRAGDWPLWFPYMRYGFALTPLALTSHAFNPLALVLGGVFHYDVWTLALENAIWRGVGLLGAFAFARRHVQSPVSAAATATAYALGGMMALSLMYSRGFFAGLMLAPWILVGVDRAVTSRNREEWLGAAGLLAIVGLFLVWGGYPATWLTAPFLVAPYALVAAGKPGQIGRLAAAGVLAGTLIVAGSCLFITESVAFPLFGERLRPTSSSFDGLLRYQALFTLWLANPQYIPQLHIAHGDHLYVGLIPVLVVCARCAVLPIFVARWHWVRWFRIGATVWAGLAIVHLAAGGADSPVLWPPVTLGLSNDVAAVVVLGVLCAASVPRLGGAWTRVDTALLVLSVSCVVAATDNPAGNALRGYVLPFSALRWNWFYLWPATLALPLLAWRALESARPDTVEANTGRFTGQPNLIDGRRRLYLAAWAVLAAVGLLAFAVARVVSVADGIVNGVSTVVVLWHALVLGVAVIAVGLVQLRIFSREAVVAAVGAVAVFGVTLVSGRIAAGQNDLVRGFVLLPANGLPAVDLVHAGVVLGAAGVAFASARSWEQRLARVALVATLDVGLGWPRHMSDTLLAVANQSATTIRIVADFPWTGSRRNGDEVPQSYAWEIMSLALHKAPSVLVWEGVIPEVAALDRTVGTPSVFRHLVLFPREWSEPSDTAEVTVGPAALAAAASGAAEPAVGECLDRSASGHAEASVARLLASEARLSVRVDCRRLLVYTDTWARGWQATMDGRWVEALRVDGVLRGVIVPAGSHELVWRYRPPLLGAQVTLMALGWAVALALWAAPAVRAAGGHAGTLRGDRGQWND